VGRHQTVVDYRCRQWRAARRRLQHRAGHQRRVVPGQKLVLETRSEDAVVSHDDGRLLPEGFWCSDDPSIIRQPIPEVESPACWRPAKQGQFSSAARLLEMEVIPSPSPPLNSPAVKPNPNRVPGQGYRFLIEVLTAGLAYIESTGACDTRRELKGAKDIIRIKCGPMIPCSTTASCDDRGECVELRCDGATPAQTTVSASTLYARCNQRSEDP